MSGGHFSNYGYIYHEVDDFADELSSEIKANTIPDEWGQKRNFSEATLAILCEQVVAMKKMAKIMQLIDKLYSDDLSEETFSTSYGILGMSNDEEIPEIEIIVDNTALWKYVGDDKDWKGTVVELVCFDEISGIYVKYVSDPHGNSRLNLDKEYVWQRRSEKELPDRVYGKIFYWCRDFYSDIAYHENYAVSTRKPDWEPYESR